MATPGNLVLLSSLLIRLGTFLFFMCRIKVSFNLVGLPELIYYIVREVCINQVALRITTSVLEVALGFTKVL